MSYLSDVIEKFVNIQQHPRVQPIYQSLVNRNHRDTKFSEQEMLQIRTDLISILADRSVQDLHNDIYNVLLALAEIAHLDDVDPISFDTISAGDRLVISTGHQFSLSNLIEFHNRRPARLVDDDRILNPRTNELFSVEDEGYIRTVAQKRGISINRDIRVEEQFSGNDWAWLMQIAAIHPAILLDIFQLRAQNDADPDNQLGRLVEAQLISEEEKQNLTQAERHHLIKTTAILLAGRMTIEESKALTYADANFFEFYPDLVVLIVADKLTWQVALQLEDDTARSIVIRLKDKILADKITVEDARHLTWPEENNLVNDNVWKLIDNQILTIEACKNAYTS